MVLLRPPPMRNAQGNVHQDVADDGDARGQVIKVDALLVMAGGTRAADVVDVVVADGGAGPAPVTHRVDGAGVSRVLHDVVDIVVLNHVVVTFEGNRLVRGVEHLVVSGRVAHAAEHDARVVGEGQPAEVVDLVPGSGVVRPRQGGTVAAANIDAAVAGAGDFAAVTELSTPPSMRAPQPPRLARVESTIRLWSPEVMRMPSPRLFSTLMPLKVTCEAPLIWTTGSVSRERSTVVPASGPAG